MNLMRTSHTRTHQKLTHQSCNKCSHQARAGVNLIYVTLLPKCVSSRCPGNISETGLFHPFPNQSRIVYNLICHQDKSLFLLCFLFPPIAPNDLCCWTFLLRLSLPFCAAEILFLFSLICCCAWSFFISCSIC